MGPWAFVNGRLGADDDERDDRWTELHEDGALTVFSSSSHTPHATPSICPTEMGNFFGRPPGCSMACEEPDHQLLLFAFVGNPAMLAAQLCEAVRTEGPLRPLFMMGSPVCYVCYYKGK